MKELLFFVLFMAAWIVLNRWVLPRFGIATCMSGACSVAPYSAPQGQAEAAATESESLERNGGQR